MDISQTTNLLSQLKFQVATPSRWPAIERLFGDRGACGGCWCMAWRLRTRDWQAGKGAKNKRALKKIVSSGERPGVVGYLNGEPVAWCSIAPRETFSFLDRSRALKPVDEQPVWSVSCMFVLKPYRRRGVSVALLKAAVAFARKRGARIVEGYPVKPTMARTPDPFVWTGIPSAFRKAGFKEVARRSKTRPIYRFTIKKK
jgi:GNAT superfamily N-acetyltransferase